MNKNNSSRKDFIKDQGVYNPAIDGRLIEVGAYEGQAIQRPRRLRSALLWATSEYVTGPLFLLVSHGYTYLVPDSISTISGMRDLTQRTLKRMIDIIGSLVGLIIASPLFIILPLAIKLESRGPVFYAQVRVGQNRRRGARRAYNRDIGDDRRRRDRRRENVMGRPFRVIKFRTMVDDAERHTGPVWATPDDPRVTRIGRILRKSRLDEVPQLICVLKGEMSLVGPRPERPVFVSELAEQVPGYARRLSVRPGITGLAQIENGYDSSVSSVVQKIQSDLRYIENWSVWADIKILVRTVRVVLTGRGAN
ncbi:MAG TPA: sugar transferase [candidate division Zixibacteria bacterium]|nr:sugar transferase [candidate division Zixibacteria bacterium]